MSQSRSWPEHVATGAGPVMGTADERDTVAWLGIPFARPPVGDLRWRAPRDPEPWEHVRAAAAFGPVRRTLLGTGGQSALLRGQALPDAGIDAESALRYGARCCEMTTKVAV